MGGASRRHSLLGFYVLIHLATAIYSKHKNGGVLRHHFYVLSKQDLNVAPVQNCGAIAK
jgi:hypothetical protein